MGLPCGTARKLKFTNFSLVIDWCVCRDVFHTISVNRSGGIAPPVTVATRAKVIAVHGDTVLALLSGRIEVTTLQSSSKKVISFTEAEGSPLCMDLWGGFLVAVGRCSNCELPLVAVTSSSTLTLDHRCEHPENMGRKLEHRHSWTGVAEVIASAHSATALFLIYCTRCFGHVVSLGPVTLVRVNCAGSKVALLCNSMDGTILESCRIC